MRRSVTSPRAAAAAAEVALLFAQDANLQSHRRAAAQAFHDGHSAMPLSLPASRCSGSSFGSQQRRTQPGTSSYRQPSGQRCPEPGASEDEGQGMGGLGSGGDHRVASPVQRAFTEQVRWRAGRPGNAPLHTIVQLSSARM